MEILAVSVPFSMSHALPPGHQQFWKPLMAQLASLSRRLQKRCPDFAMLLNESFTAVTSRRLDANKHIWTALKV